MDKADNFNIITYFQVMISGITVEIKLKYFNVISRNYNNEQKSS